MNYNEITKETYIEILNDREIIDDDIILIFNTICSINKKEASATDLARIIGWPDKNSVTGKIVGLGKRVLKKFNIDQRIREDGTNVYWDIFFTGYQKGNFFIYQIRKELEDALIETKKLNNDSINSIQNYYLFVWNPKNWNWESLEEDISNLKLNGKVTRTWSCISHKSIRIGDRVFIIILGQEPKGIFASGKVISNPFLSPHWNDENKNIYKVSIELEILLNPSSEPILTLEYLNSETLSKQNWFSQASGISIRNDVTEELEKLWFEFLQKNKLKQNYFLDYDNSLPTYVEGASIEITQTRYERNPYVRKECLKYHGYSYKICNFNFEKFYGNLGYKYIHVHHITPISTNQKETTIDPIKDLIPVCPNCHAMLHKSNPPLSVEELKEIIEENEK
ncbi:MAG: HNH endonuclease [Leptospiraceae bacterium]|nr:HNH endonuclease [Leptospiraceae bacterium]